MEQKEIDTIIDNHINKALDNAIKEIAEISGLTINRVIEDYRISLKKSLFKVRKEL